MMSSTVKEKANDNIYEISMKGRGRGEALGAVSESPEVILMVIFMKGEGGHSVAILSFYTEYSFNRQSVHLSVSSKP